MARTTSPLELWIGEELHKAGITKHRSARVRRVVLADPAFMAIGQKYTPYILENHHEFMRRYALPLSSLQMNTAQFRRHLLKLKNTKELRRFDRVVKKGNKLHQQRESEQRRFIKKYAARYP
jgi:hypothetical protein